MHNTNSITTWLPILASLLAVCLGASAALGQDSVIRSNDDAHITPTGTEFIANDQVVIQPTVRDGVLPDLMGQVVMTLLPRGRTEPVRICPGDDVWLISARQSHCSPCDLSLLQCSRLGNGNWNHANLDDLLHLHSMDKSKVTMLYVHGNRTGLKWAKSRGLQFYKNAFRKVKRPPVRFVIFAWRSDSERVRLAVDYGIKAQRSLAVGKTLGRLLGEFNDREIVIGGYSLGAQVVLSALSLPEFQTLNEHIGKFRVAIIAPALDADFIDGCLRGFPCIPSVHQTEVFVNERDCAIKMSKVIAHRRNKSDATLDDVAIVNSNLPNPIVVRDITCEVKKRHSIVNYGQSTTLNVKLAQLLGLTFEGGRSLGLATESFPGQPLDLESAPAKTGAQELADPAMENAVLPQN